MKPNAPKHDRKDLTEKVAFLRLIERLHPNAKEVQKLAESMEKAGHSPKDIFKATEKLMGPDQTGAFRGPEGEWLFQITDNMKFKPETWQRLTSKQRMDKTGKLGDFVDHNIFNYEPELREVETRLVQPEHGSSDRTEAGYNNPTKDKDDPTKDKPHGQIEVFGDPKDRGPDATGEYGVPRLLRHELQHAADNKQGLSQGSNTNNDFAMAAHSNLVHPTALKWKKDLEALRKESGQGEAWALNNPEQSDYLAAASDLFGKPHYKNISSLDYKKRYLNVAGETRARRAADQSDNIDELRAGEPWAPVKGKYNPQELQLIAEHADLGGFRMPKDRGTLARLLGKGAIGAGAAAATGSAASASERGDRVLPAETPEASVRPPVARAGGIQQRVEEARQRSKQADARARAAPPPGEDVMAGERQGAGQLALDTLKGAATGGRHALEWTAGLPGDITGLNVLGAEGLQAGAGKLGDMYAPGSGAGDWMRDKLQGPVDFFSGIHESNPMPSGDAVSEYTDSLGGPDWLKDWTRHDPGTNPWANAAQQGVEWLADPLDFVPATKLARIARKIR